MTTSILSCIACIVVCCIPFPAAGSRILSRHAYGVAPLESRAVAPEQPVSEALLYQGIIEGGVRIGKSVLLTLVTEPPLPGQTMPRFKIRGTYLGPFSAYEYVRQQSPLLVLNQSSWLELGGIRLRILFKDYSATRIVVDVYGLCTCTGLGTEQFTRVFDGTLSTKDKLVLGGGHYLAVDAQNSSNEFCVIRLYRPTEHFSEYLGQLTLYTRAPRQFRIAALGLRIEVLSFDISSNGNTSVRMTIDKRCDCSLFDCRSDVPW